MNIQVMDEALAECERNGQTDMNTRIDQLADRLSPARMAIYLLGRMLEPPEDRWSGLGNDGRRAYADGVRRAIAEWLDGNYEEFQKIK